MAIRKSSVLGPITGKLQNTVTRFRYGKCVVYAKPDSYRISNSEKAVEGRARFAFTVRLARLINSEPVLSAAWKSAKIQGTNSYQKIIKHNSRLTSHSGLTAENIITPEGSEIDRSNLILDEEKLIIRSEFEPSFLIPPFRLFSLAVLKNKTGDEMILLGSEDVKQSDDNSLEGIIMLSREEQLKFSESCNIILLSSFISTSSPVFWSSTLSFNVYRY
jgi:hypothetical protein